MPDSTENIVISQKKLKLLAGGLAIALPTIMYLGNNWVYGQTEILSSISSYYYSNMRDVFVGILFSVGVFLISYEGYNTFDRLLSSTGGIMAIIVALAPTTKDGETMTTVNAIHLLAAATFFLILGIFSTFLFTKSDPKVPKTKLKRVRNLIYYVSGMLIFASLIFLVLVQYGVVTLPVESPGFWLEYVGISAFGTAWLVKGEGIFLLNDDPILEMNPWEILGFVILIALVLGSFIMLTDIFF